MLVIKMMMIIDKGTVCITDIDMNDIWAIRPESEAHALSLCRCLVTHSSPPFRMNEFKVSSLILGACSA